MTSLFLTVVLLPFAYFFYETCEDDDYKTRFCTAFGNEMILLVVFCCINFPMFASWRHAFVPLNSEAYTMLPGMTATPVAKSEAATRLNDIFLLPDNP